MTVLKRCLPLVLVAVAVSACGLFSSEQERLPGERIAVLPADTGIEPDAALAGTPPELPAPVENDRWSQPGGSPTHVMGHLHLSRSLAADWQASVGRGEGRERAILGEPVVADGRVYVMDALATVSAYDADSGQRIWRRDLTPEDERRGFFGGGLAHADGQLFVTTGFARAFALDAESGETLWERGVGAPIRVGPAVDSGRVIAVTLNSRTIALSAEDGRELWSHQGIEEELGLLGTATPAVADGIVVTAYSSGELFALRADNGRMLWQDTLGGLRRSAPMASLADIRGLPVVDGDRVFAVSNANRTVAIDLTRGARAWEREAGGTQMPWLAGSDIFLVTNRAQVIAVEADSGRVRWLTQLDRFQKPDERREAIAWYGPVLAGGGLILAGGHGEAVILSPEDGSVETTFTLPDGAVAPPVVAGNTLYTLSKDATLTAWR